MRKSVFALLAVVMLLGCRDEVDSTPDSTLNNGSLGKGDSVSACSADEPLIACLSEKCPDLAGAEFNDCFDTSNCADAATDTPDDCSGCVVAGFDAGFDAAGIAVACAGAGASAEADCASDEPVLACINAECAGLVDTDFDACFEANCEADATDTPVECALCMASGFEARLDAAKITAACTGAAPGASTLTGVACGADDLQLFTCINNGCPNADTSETVGECIADVCTSEAQETSVACLVCVDAHLTSSAPGTAEESCTADDSAPCSVEVATAMRTCADDLCSGMQGIALDDCMDQACPEVFDDITDHCGQCIIGLNGNGVPFGEAAGHCAGG